MITPEALAVSPGTVTNVDIKPFFFHMDDQICMWNWEEHHKEMDWENYSRDKCRYDSIAKKIAKQCGCKPRFFDDAWDICEEGRTCNGTCRGAGITCAAEIGMVSEYTDCPKPCFDVAMNENSVSYSGKLLHVNHILSLTKC